MKRKLMRRAREKKADERTNGVRAVEAAPEAEHPHAQMLELQRLYGNQAVQRLLKSQANEDGTALMRSPEDGSAAPPTLEDASQSSMNPKIAVVEMHISWLEHIQAIVESPEAELDKKSKKTWESTAWKHLHDPNLYKRYKEAGQDWIMMITALIESSRLLLGTLTADELGVDEKTLKRIKAGYYRKLNSLSPYFTQMANQNFLPNFKEGNEAWSRTCNLTSMSMTLTALGIAPTDFNGDMALLTMIAAQLDPALKTADDVANLRMPDFLQLVVIYDKYVKGSGDDFDKRVKKAQKTASGVISTTLEVFVDTASHFSVERTKTGYIASFGTQEAGQSLNSQKKKLQKELRTKKITQEEYSAQMRVLEEQSSDLLEKFSTAQYQKAVEKKIDPEIDAGGQIISNMPGHYTRLENTTADGIVIDDPANNGKNFHVTWSDANKKGYFRGFQVFKKK
jgi:hypothetical protein